MGLFDKKFCDVCGSKIGFLGNRKLEDGNLCKDCAAKLSPWFSERRHSTLEEVKAQLDYREENKQAVSSFNATRSIGKYYSLVLDEDAHKFLVTSSKDFKNGNPDILDYSQALGCDLDINESRTELKQSKDGKQVSYDPPRYEYSYNFYATIRVNHPYFDEMRFQINSGSVRTGERCMSGNTTGWRINMTDVRANLGIKEYNDYMSMGNEIKEAVENMHQQARGLDAPAQQAPGQEPVPQDAQGMAQSENVNAQQGYPQQNAYGRPGVYVEQGVSGQQGYQQQNAYGQPGAYPQQGVNTQQGYPQQNAYGQPGAYPQQGYNGQQPGFNGQNTGYGAPGMTGVPGAGMAAAGAAGAAGAAAAGAAAAGAMVKCPWCGLMTNAASGKCDHCGGGLG